MSNQQSIGGAATGIHGSGARFTRSDILEKINTEFRFTTPDREQIGQIQENTDKFKEFATQVVNLIPDENDQYVAYLKLLDCMYWSNAALYKASGNVARKAG